MGCRNRNRADYIGSGPQRRDRRGTVSASSKSPLKEASMEALTTATCVKTVAELCSVSAAAEALGVSQPALSSRIKKLEGQLGAQVFDRSRTPLTITDAGRAYLEAQEDVDAVWRRLAQRISDMQELKSGRLVVGGAGLFNSTVLPRAIALFNERYPGVEISVMTDNVPNLTQAALRGSLDLFITPVPNDNLNLESEELLEEKLLLCASASSPVVAQLPSAGKEGYAVIGKDEFALLAAEPFVMLDSKLQLGRKLKQLFDLYHVQPRHCVTVDQTSTGFALSLAGMGTCIIAQSAVQDFAANANIALYLADEDICKRSLYIARLKGASRSRAEEEFSAVLKEVVSKPLG